MSTAVKVWLFDAEALMIYNGNVHERCACLFGRADEWQKENPHLKLLVVLDHISEYYKDSKTPSDRGILWNELKSLVNWKKDKRWTLFIVESDPSVMVVGNMDYAKTIFSQRNKVTQAVCIPFDGAIFFEKVMTQLIDENAVTIDNGRNNTEWNELVTNMRYFSLTDAYSVYYMDLRNKAKEMFQAKGFPIAFKFDYLAKIIADHSAVFKENSIERMAAFAKSIGDDGCFDDSKIIETLKEDEKKKGVDVNISDKSPFAKVRNKELPTRKTPVKKSTMLMIAVIIITIIVILLCVWSCT